VVALPVNPDGTARATLSANPHDVVALSALTEYPFALPHCTTDAAAVGAVSAAVAVVAAAMSAAVTVFLMVSPRWSVVLL